FGVGEHAWIAGRPGSFVLTTKDAGASWKSQPTGQTTPLNGVFFLDESRGWAVGDLGTILSTKDGGQTWTVQRQAAKPGAGWFVQAKAEDFPVDTIAVLGAAAGYCVAAWRVVAADPATAPLRRAGESLRLAAAVRQAGGVTAEALWQFPVPPH